MRDIGYMLLLVAILVPIVWWMDRRVGKMEDPLNAAAEVGEDPEAHREKVA